MTNNNQVQICEYLRGRMNGEGLVAASIHRREYSFLMHILRLGVTPNEYEDCGVSALSCAVKANDLTAVGLLLNANADPNGVEFEDFTPLQHAIMNDNIIIAAMLLARGARVGKMPNPEGSLTAEAGMSEEMRQLVEKFKNNVY